MNFNRKKTVSDILDEQEEKLKIMLEKQEQRDKKRLEKGEEEIEKIVNSQFSNAKQKIGHRLSTKKEHSTMYRFYFKSNKFFYTCYIFGNTRYPDKDTIFKIRPYSFSWKSAIDHYRYNEEIKLSQLAGYLVDWVNFIIYNE